MGVNILVIKLGALGDMVQALGPMAAIRRYHADVQVTALTTKPYATFLRASGFFDSVWVDSRPSLLNVGAWIDLRRRFRNGGIRRVYDLQTSDRSGWYFRLFGNPRPEWSGIAVGCSHPHINPQRDAMHTIERQREQLAAAGIMEAPSPDLDWLDADTTRFQLPQRYVLLAAGGAAHRPGKRWPAFAQLATALAARALTPVLLGTVAERDVTTSIRETCPAAIDLTGQTSLMEIAGLARRAAGAVGNDTGPMHLIAATGCPSVVLYSHASDPTLCAQRGADVRIIRRPSLGELSTEEVEAQLTLR